MATHVPSSSTPPLGRQRALERIPLELWTLILQDVVAEYAPTLNGTFIHNLELMRNWKDNEHQRTRAKATSLRRTLSLVCRKFYRILANMDHRVTVVSGGLLTQLGMHNLEHSKSVFFYPAQDKLEPSLQSVEFLALRFLHVENLHFDLCDLLTRSPRLYALSIGFPYPTSFLWSVFDHSVASQLTHLSLTMKRGMWLEPISLQSLHFLRLNFVRWCDYTLTTKTSGREIMPCAFPRLSSLVLCGHMAEGWFPHLVPFLQRHRDTVIRHANELILVRSSGEEEKAVTAPYFGALKLYRASVNELFATPHSANPLPGETLLPLTMLLNSRSIRILAGRIEEEGAVPSMQTGIRLPGTLYSVNQVMMYRPWDKTALELEIPTDPAHISAIRWLISRGVQVVDCHEVDFDDFANFCPRPEQTEEAEGNADETLTSSSPQTEQNEDAPDDANEPTEAALHNPYPYPDQQPPVIPILQGPSSLWSQFIDFSLDLLRQSLLS
ncbi:SubName: Full=Uncharacterized protein {ECO:0000313/EMBL:CCA75847.1} [Serendipita indica DSM 11827]|uniref:Uncharacterized protein n=1 Tax=Serendipita indica (strain DSM 11827) TaxID=1109443 RepID=G4TX04_SERID|nr:SubName: Full=Uncharacterized protein {ECO:0000313/EMBL:CCA75847.1} [Serendipita indica DSM 11827]CCA75847.1 hypothetical protein PIIN_09835 [Serendipita indica DSM 11827]